MLQKLWAESWFRYLLAGAALTALVVGYFALQERAAQAEAKGFASGRQVEIDAATARMKQRQRQFDMEKAALVKERDQIKTQKQAIQVITKYLPATQGQVVEVKREDLPPAARAALPDSPGYSCMTEAAAVELGKAAADLELCGKERVKLTADVGDMTTKYTAAVEQRDKYKTVAKGGTWAQKAKSAGKWTTIGAAIGAAAVYVVTHKK